MSEPDGPACAQARDRNQWNISCKDPVLVNRTPYMLIGLLGRDVKSIVPASAGSSEVRSA
jgi:hypothetical protein